jgi:hypothetical protein
MNYLPSKEFQKKALIILMCFIGLLAVSLLVNSQNKFVTSNNVKSVVVVKDIISKDTDGDGLKDWEEPLWGMDPKKIDTDGNGKTDLEEVREAQSALSRNNKAQDQESKEMGSTETGRTALDVVQLISSLYQSGSLSENNVADVQKKIEEYIKNRGTVDKYSQSDITSVPLSKDTALAYVKKINTVFGKYPIDDKDFSYVSLSLQQYLQDGTGEDKYAALDKKYHSLAEELSKVSVPNNTVSTHLAVINSIYNVGEFFADIRAHETDPIRTLSATIQYQDILTKLNEAMNALINLIFNS